MSNFTIELGTLFEQGYPLNLNDYPIYDEDYRQVLNNKIINHFYLREIGAETPDRFNFYLGRKMQEIMPYYNQMYKSELLEFDPLANNYQEALNKFMRESENASNSQNSGFSGESSTDIFTANQDTLQDFTQQGTHNQGIKGSYSKQGDSEENSKGTNLRTDDLAENTTETTHTDQLTTNDLKEQLDEVLGTLTEREQKVLRLRFGLDDSRARTLEEVGKEFNVTRERIRQIEAKALRKLRHPSRSRKLKDYLD